MREGECVSMFGFVNKIIIVRADIRSGNTPKQAVWVIVSTVKI